MKKASFTLALGMSLCAITSCTGNTECNANDTDSTGTAENTEVAAAPSINDFPWDFPQNVKIEAEPDQYVLAPYTFYKSALKKGKDLLKETLIFYSTKMTTPGEEKSVVNGDVQLPNALIIPLDKNAQAKKGDILLTWWQSGSGLKRAIVKDASNPAEPKIEYLDMDYSDDPAKPGLAQKHADDQLKPGSFNILTKGEWQPGAQLACKNESGKWEIATLIHEQDGKVLAYGFGSRVTAYNKNDVKLVPFKEDIKPGDMVWGRFAATWDKDYKVIKVDNNVGRVWVEKNGKTEIKSILEVTKVL